MAASTTMPPRGASAAARSRGGAISAPRRRSTSTNTPKTAANAQTASAVSQGVAAGACRADHSASVPSPSVAAASTIQPDARRARAAHPAPAASATSISARGTTRGATSAQLAK